MFCFDCWTWTVGSAPRYLCLCRRAGTRAQSSWGAFVENYASTGWFYFPLPAIANLERLICFYFLFVLFVLVFVMFEFFQRFLSTHV
jgi:hypothetical protein